MQCLPERFSALMSAVAQLASQSAKQASSRGMTIGAMETKHPAGVQITRCPVRHSGTERYRVAVEASGHHVGESREEQCEQCAAPLGRLPSACGHEHRRGRRREVPISKREPSQSLSPIDAAPSTARCQ